MQKRKGRFSRAEKSMLQAADPNLSPEKAAERLAPVLNRSEAALTKGIIEARQNFQSRAIEYAEIHIQGARVAAASGNTKPAEWALKQIESQGQRVVPRDTAEDSGGIRIILANVRLGGMDVKEEPQIETIDAERP
jgi:hypothetical protein